MAYEEPYHCTIQLVNKKCQSLRVIKEPGLQDCELVDIRSLSKGRTRHACMREKFIQLKKYLTIIQTAKPEKDEIEKLSQAVLGLQRDVNTYKTVAETPTRKKDELEQKVKDLEKSVDALTASIAPFRKLPKELLSKFIDLGDEDKEEQQ